MPDTPTLTEVINLIKFIVNNFDDGLAILLGRAEPPSAAEMYDKKCKCQADYGVRIAGGENLPKPQVMLETVHEEIIHKLGGWQHITNTFNYYRRLYPETWLLFEMSSLFVRPGGMTRDGKGGATKMISQKFNGITAKTQRRRRDAYIRTIALFLITRPLDDKFRLYDDPALYQKLN